MNREWKRRQKREDELTATPLFIKHVLLHIQASVLNVLFL